MANEGDVSLLFKLRMEAQQTKTAPAEAQAAVRQLRAVFGTELGQMAAISQTAFQKISASVEDFARQRVPVVGPALAGVNSHLRQIATGSGPAAKGLESLGLQIGELAKKSGKTTSEVTGFLTKFVQLEGQSKRNDAAFKFFGGSVDLIGNKTAKFIPELEKAGAELVAVSGEAAGAGASIAAIAGPIGIAVIALLAMAAATIFVSKEIFDLTKRVAEFEGALFDLSQQTGISVETLSALEVVAATTGGSLGSMTAALGIFQRKLDEAQDPLSKTAAQFRKLNVDTENTEDALRETLKALNEMKPGFEQTALALELFGRGGKQLLAVLKETGGDLDGTIAKLRELGILITTEQAQAADEFNDQLALIGFQLRSVTALLAQDAMPLILAALKEFSQALKENRDVIRAVGIVIAGFTFFLTSKFREGLLAVRVFILLHKAAWQGLIGILNNVIDAYEKIRQKISAIIALPPIPRIEPPPPAGVQTPPVEIEDTARKDLKDKIAAQDELTAAQKAAAEERKRIAGEELATAEANFIRGSRTRRQDIESQIKANREKIQADLDLLAFERSKALTQAALAQSQKDPQKEKEFNAKIIELDQDAANKRSELRNFEVKLRAQLEVEERQNALSHQSRLLDIQARGDRARIDSIRASVADGVRAALDGEKEIQNIEQTGLDRRSSFLVKSLELAGAEPAKRQEILDQLKALSAERVALEQEQARRLRDIQRRSAETQLAIIIAAGETALRIGEINNARRLANIQALAERQVITEEEAAKRVLKVQEESLIAQEALLRIRLRAASTIQDPNERAKAEADINNQLKILGAERAQIQEDGNRSIDDARKRDIENARKYADELQEINERIRDIELETAQEVVDLMIASHARRIDVIRAERDLAIAQENERHNRALRGIEREKRENRESTRSKEDKQRKEEELNREAEAEEERHQRRMQNIKKGSENEEQKADPLGRLDIAKDQIKEIAEVLESSIVPLGEILTGTFNQITQAIGQTISNWVLLGETGPAVMRKILAQALASIAAEAAINAIKELALGFATLFFNPAESAAHFTAAAIWGSIAGVTAVVGRGVAGDLFKQKQPGAGGASASGKGARAGGGSTSEPKPLDFARNNSQPQKDVLEIRFTGALGDVIEAEWIQKYRGGGRLRNLVMGDQEI